MDVRTTAARKTERQENSDFRLLLSRLRSVPLDEKGSSFVRRALAEGGLLNSLAEQELVEVAMIARQHGLLDEAVKVYRLLHERFPASEEGWQHHLEMLLLLDDRRGLVKLEARAAQALPGGKWEALKQRLPDLRPGTDEQPRDDVCEPFAELRREEEEIALFLRIFRGREDAFARQWVDRREGKQGYVPVRRPLGAADVREHLGGQRTYGIYLLDRQSRVSLGVVDVDLVPRLRDAQRARKERATIRRETIYLHKRIATLARRAGLCCLAEVSGGKGYHFWFPLREPVPAADMRAALRGLLGKLDEDLSCFSLEVFPKQDKRSGKGFGNLVKLPLGIHRVTGKPSSFVLAADSSRESQFALLAALTPSPAETVTKLAALQGRGGEIIVHPRHAAWAEEYPELAVLEERCSMLGQIMATVRSARSLSLREEKILLSTLGHLPRAGLLLHHLFSALPEYNRPLLDYKIGRVRGTVLGCKRIHRLLEQNGELPCRFSSSGYPHPLRHLEGFAEKREPRSEKVENLRDALGCLQRAIRQVERFL